MAEVQSAVDLDILTLPTRMGEYTMGGDEDIPPDETSEIPVETRPAPEAASEGHTTQPLPDTTTQDDGDMGDLFGDDEEVGSQKEETRNSSPTPSLRGSDADGLTAAERKKRKAMEYEEDEAIGDEQVLELNEAHMQLPNLSLPNSSDSNYWILRLPNFIKLDSQPFDRETYQGIGGENEDLSSSLSTREKSMGIKLEVENTIRWRWVKGPDGQMRKQSNSRIVKWSDGSMSLQLGKELFDVSANIDLPMTTAPRPAVTNLSQEAPSQHNVNRNQGLTYLFAQHRRAELLQAEAAITGTLTLKPTGMQSETHRKLVKAVGQKHSKVTRLMMAPDPTKESEQERADQLKAAKKTSAKKRRVAGDSPARRRAPVARSSKASRRERDMDWSDEDPSDDDDGFSGGRLGRTPQSTTKRAGAGDYEPDEFVVEDDEEEEGAARGDVLDEADEAIEEAHRARRRDKKVKSPTKKRSLSDDDDDEEEEETPMDAEDNDEDGAAMEVSEDENEPAVRPATGRKKARRLATLDDADEDE